MIVRKHNLTDNSFSSVTDKDILYEFDIITEPESAKATQIKDVKIKKNNRKGFREDIINGYYIFSKNYGWIECEFHLCETRNKRLTCAVCSMRSI